MASQIVIERAKLNRIIKQQGADYVFTRAAENEFKEPSKTVAESIRLRCMLHQTRIQVTKTAADAATSQSKILPMLLCGYESFTATPVKLGDKVTLKGTVYSVTGATNTGGADISVDISLEEV